jgi:DNA-3-methyladenine glycosylase II
MSKSYNHVPKFITIRKTGKIASFLSEIDLNFKEAIDQIVPITIKLNPQKTIFESLGTAILHQQLHGKAAAKILERLKVLFGSPVNFPKPIQVVAATEDKLMLAGLSRSKSKALKDLAEKVSMKVIPNCARAKKMSDLEIIKSFSQVKGIGRWTAEMCLIFTLGRQDVLPIDDFGIRKGFMKVYRKRRIPTPKELEKYGEKWRPFRTAAALFLWKALELPMYQDKKIRKKIAVR